MSDSTVSAPPAVVVEGAGKTFRRPRDQMHTLKERALHPFRARLHDDFEALRDVSFAVAPGEFFGIVGRNGSGKSTLLKCMAGIYGLSRGRIYVDGTLSTFIELGVGFNPDLPAYDNVVVNGIMLGLSPKEAAARFDRVIEFAELEDFVDLKLKNYSSGMHVRLAFAVMIQVDADVLLIDEVLAVGDAAFQQKCFDVFHDLRARGKTILFVTHDMGAVERFCDRALLLEHGKVVDIGTPRDIAARYVDINFRQEAGDGQPEPRGGTGAARMVEAWMEDSSGERKTVLMQGEQCTFKARALFHAEVEDPELQVAWVNEHNQNHLVVSTATQLEHTGRFAAGEQTQLSVTFDNVLAPGRYYVSTVIARHGGGQELLDRWERIFSVVVAGPRATGGLVDLPHALRLERVTDPEPAPLPGRAS
ncbi:MAG: type transport system ATP-binding protein [Solirubrobacteraceae bacterium]|nr:type transport system ATP-binding protein [Solirubrobacteraceae bacterium]